MIEFAEIVGDGLPDLRQQRFALLLPHELRGVGRDVEDLAVGEGVGPGLAQPLVEGVARAHREAGPPLAVVGDRDEVALDVEEVDAGGEVAVEEGRVGDRDVHLAAPLRQGSVDARVDAGAEQVALAQAHIGQHAGIRRIAAAERDLAGGALRHLGVQHRAVRRRARRGRHLHVGEVAEVADALARAADLRGVEGVALGDAEFAADHPVLGAGVAADVDALDEDPRRLVHLEGEVHAAVLAVALDARLHVHEGEAAEVHRVLERLRHALHRVAVVPVPFLDLDQAAQARGVEVAEVGDHVHPAHAVAGALVQR